VQLRVAAVCPLGSHPLRLRQDSISNLLLFSVGCCRSKKNAPATRQVVPLVCDQRAAQRGRRSLTSGWPRARACNRARASASAEQLDLVMTVSGQTAPGPSPADTCSA
jgi:hypothetical protein